MRTPSSRLLLAAALAALAALPAGCGKSPTSPSGGMTQTTADDMATQVGSGMATDDGGVLSTVWVAGSGSSAFAPQGGLSTMATAAETTFTVGGITYTLSRTFYDAGDNVMAGFDPILTARVHATSRATGAIATQRFTATVGRSGWLDVRGVSALAETLAVDGASYDTCQSSFRSLDGLRTRYFYMVASCSLAALRWLKPPANAPWPLSGTATWTIRADRLRSNNRADIEAHFEAVVVVTFNGTQYADLEVTGGWRYRLDLKTGAVTRA